MKNYNQPGRKLRGALGFSNMLEVAWAAGGATRIVLFISRLIIIVIPTVSGDVICGGFSRMTECPTRVDSRHPMVPPCEKLLITLHFQQWDSPFGRPLSYLCFCSPPIEVIPDSPRITTVDRKS